MPLIYRNDVRARILSYATGMHTETLSVFDVVRLIDDTPSVDAVPIVRCNDCIHAVPLDSNCELNTSVYMHCNLLRGNEAKYVWHKYKRYYKDYSLVERDGFCSGGERQDNT